MVCREVCYLHPLEVGLGMPNIEIRRGTLRLHFLDRMYTQDDENGSFLEEVAKTAFLPLRSLNSAQRSTVRTETIDPSTVNSIMPSVSWGIL